MQLTRCRSPLSALPRNFAYRRRFAGCPQSRLPARTDDCSSGNIAARASPPFRILFAGSDIFSCESLKVLAEAAKHEPELIGDLQVVTPPDKRVTRGLKTIRESPLKIMSAALGLRTHILPLEGMLEWKLPADFSNRSSSNLLVTASFPHLIPQTILDSFWPLNAINVHPSLIPKYRGAAPIQHALSNLNTSTGVTIQTLSPGSFDRGLILQQIDVPLSRCTYLEAEKMLASESSRLLLQTLKDLPNAQEHARSQAPGKHRLAPKISIVDAFVDWTTLSAEQIEAQYRAFGHQHLPWVWLGSKRVQLDRISIAAVSDSGVRLSPGDAVLSIDQTRVFVGCAKETLLSIELLKTEGRKALPPLEWWKGTGRDARKITLTGSKSDKNAQYQK